MAVEDDKTKVKKVAVPDEELGGTGTVLIGGYLSDTDHNADLTGLRGIQEYDKMRKGDGTVRAALLAIKLPILSASWFIEPASDDQRDIDIAKRIERNLFNEMTIGWQETLRHALLSLDYGRMVFELVYEIKEDGIIGWRKFAPRLPHTIQAWLMTDGEKGIRQWLPTGEAEVNIPIEKLVIHTHEKEGDNWEGISVLRSAHRHWKIKDALYKFDAIAHERFGVGIPIGKLPANASPVEEANLAEFLKNLRANEEAYFKFKGEGWELKYLESTGGRDPFRSIQHHNRQIVLSVLAQFLDLGSGGGGGSYSLTRGQQDLFMLSLNAAASHVAETFSKYAIERWVNINFPTVTEYPVLKYADIGDVDIKDLTTSLQRVIQVGALAPDEQIEDFLRESMHLPERPEGAGEEKALLALIDQTEADATTETPEEAELGMPDEEDEDEEAPAGPPVEATEGAMMKFLGASRIVSPETREKIRQALKKFWDAKGRKGKKKGKGKSRKAKDPAKEAERAERKAERKRKKGLRTQMKRIRSTMRKEAQKMKLELLKAKAKGEKLEPEKMAQMQLKLEQSKAKAMDKLDALSFKLSEGEIEGVIEAKEKVDVLIEKIESE